MRQRILRYFFFVGFVFSLLTMFITYFLFQNFTEQRIREDLTWEAKSLAVSFNQLTPEGYGLLLERKRPDTRITLINSNGEVRFDSNHTEPLDNHLQRIEVREALKNGDGFEVRYSTTEGKNNYYYARKLNDGSVLRLSRDSVNILSDFWNLFPTIVALLLFLMVVTVLLARRLTKNLLDPVVQTYQEDSALIDTYPELAPFTRKIKEQKRELDHQMRTLHMQQDQSNLVFTNMQEGLILVDSARNVSYMNPISFTMLEIDKDKHDAIIGHNIYLIIKDRKLLNLLEEAFSGKNSTATVKIENKYLEFHVNVMYKEKKIQGVILFVVDVTARKRMEKLRSDFTANVSHELKTPLTSISGFAEIIEMGMVKKKDIQNFSHKIKTETRRLIGLIEDIIRLSELDDLGMEKQLYYHSVHQLVEDTILILEFPASQKNISITTEFQVEEIFSYLDEKIFQDMMFNVLDNAIKYNKTSGNVHVRLFSTAGIVHIEVHDTGIGIEKKDRDRVFERFYRVDKSRSKLTGGTGLGLSIVMHCATQLGGSVRMDSEVGVGTTIHIAFPICLVDRPERQIEETEEDSSLQTSEGSDESTHSNESPLP